jgi:hypothetical protein
MKNLKKFEGKEVKNGKAVKGGADGKTTGLNFVHEYKQNERATASLK